MASPHRRTGGRGAGGVGSPHAICISSQRGSRGVYLLVINALGSGRASKETIGAAVDANVPVRFKEVAVNNVKKLWGKPVDASDGPIGSVHDLYFDEQTWSIRYLVVDTGTWLPGRK